MITVARPQRFNLSDSHKQVQLGKNNSSINKYLT